MFVVCYVNFGCISKSDIAWPHGGSIFNFFPTPYGTSMLTLA